MAGADGDRRCGGPPGSDREHDRMSREGSLAETFVELADTLVANFDLIDFLHSLADRTVALLDVDAVGLMVYDERGELAAIASSTESTRLLELFELQNAEGPCCDCCRSGRQVVNVARADAGRRWPSFHASMRREGFASAHALPLRLRGEVLGAVNLFCAARETLGEGELALGQALADVATIGLLQERNISRNTLLVEQLQHALESRVVIEQAKGVLAERSGTSMDDAFARLRGYARAQRRPLRQVADDVVGGNLERLVRADTSMASTS